MINAVDATRSDVARIFDEVAPSYDTVGPEFFARFGRRLVELAAIAPGMRVLDVGTGAGAALIPAAEAVGPDGHVLGIDISAAMVARTAAEVRHRRWKHVDVRSGDAAIPGVDARDRDRVLAAQVLFFLPDLAQALRAYRHILVPGGVLAISSWGPDEKRWQDVQKSLFASIPPEDMPRITPSGDAFRTDKTIAVALEDVGFVDVHSVTETYERTFDNAEQWLSWTRSHAARAYWDAIPTPMRAAARSNARTLLGGLAEPDGRLVVPTTVRYTLATRP